MEKKRKQKFMLNVLSVLDLRCVSCRTAHVWLQPDGTHKGKGGTFPFVSVRCQRCGANYFIKNSTAVEARLKQQIFQMKDQVKNKPERS